MQYFAVTSSTPDKASKMLRVYTNGIVEQYDAKLKKWRDADAGVGGIYTGDIEVEAVSKSQAETIINGWN